MIAGPDGWNCSTSDSRCAMQGRMWGQRTLYIAAGCWVLVVVWIELSWDFARLPSMTRHQCARIYRESPFLDSLFLLFVINCYRHGHGWDWLRFRNWRSNNGLLLRIYNDALIVLVISTRLPADRRVRVMEKRWVVSIVALRYVALVWHI